MNSDPTLIAYVAIQLYKLWQDDTRMDAELAAIQAKGLDVDGVLDEIKALRDAAAQEARDAVNNMPD